MSTLVDSCGWIAWLVGDPRAPVYRQALLEPEQVMVPTIVLFEVAKWVQRERGEEAALYVAAQMQRCRVLPLDAATALFASELALQHRLATADALVYAHARLAGAEVWTSDRHFAGLEGVRIVEG